MNLKYILIFNSEFLILHTKEQLQALGFVCDIFRGKTKNFHNTGQLFFFTLSRKQGVSGEQLSHDTAQAKHVNRWRVVQAEYNIRRSIEATLYVGVNCKKEVVN